MKQTVFVKFMQQAYRAGHESIPEGACTGTSLDDSHMDDAIRDILKDHQEQSTFSEMPHPVSCEGCPFLARGCTVPGGVCVRREIKGVPGRRVGDVLEGVGVIEPGWRVSSASL